MAIFLVVKAQKPDKLGLDCCKTIRVSSTNLMRTFQPLAIGTYVATGGKINNRLVYKHTESIGCVIIHVKCSARNSNFADDLYAYYWNWGRRQGENWMIGESFRNSQHRIESRNMQGRTSSWCITDINLTGFPFSIFTTSTWTRDGFLRIECLDHAESCCRRLALVSASDGLGSLNQPARLGIYQATALKNGRFYYSKEDGSRNFIYYWDWGPNNGANWVVTNRINDGSNRGIESANVEYGVTNHTMCFNDARNAGEFRVFNSRTGVWENDRSIRVLCDPN